MTGAIVVGDRGALITQGRWEWPAFASGLALLAAAAASARRRPSLAHVIGGQGITAAFFAHHACVAAFGARSTTSLLAVAFALGALLLGSPLLASTDRTTSRFAPAAHRGLLLAGTVASVASATFLSTSALYRAHVGTVLGEPTLVASALFCGSVALLQGTCAVAILRMRGVGLVLGLAAAVISVLNVSTLVSLPSLACGLVALIALAMPLALRRAARDATERTRVDPIVLRTTELDGAPVLELASPLALRVERTADEELAVPTASRRTSR